MVGGAAKKPVVVVVGSGFSKAMTSGAAPILGRKPLPTLDGLSRDLLSHMRELRSRGALGLFPLGAVADAISTLEANEARSPSDQYTFEQLISLLAISESLGDLIPPGGARRHRGGPEVLRAIFYSLSSLFTEYLSYDGSTRVNRNFFYRVNDEARARAFKEEVWRLVDSYDVTFVSFNYDGIVESFLDHWLGEDRGFRYMVEISHGIPLAMPEHAFSRRDNRDFSRFPNLPRVLKPHGSIHFFQVRDEVRELAGGPRIAAVHPRLDIGFEPKTAQRDIADVRFYEYTDPVPVIVPPMLNKESYFAGSYFRVVARSVADAMQRSARVVVLGFSLPPSDLHICSLFEAVDWSTKKVGLVLRSGHSDSTASNWRRVVGDGNSEVVGSSGVTVDSISDISAFWNSIREFLDR